MSLSFEFKKKLKKIFPGLYALWLNRQTFNLKKTIPKLLRGIFPGLYRLLAEKCASPKRKKISRILDKPDSPVNFDSEILFNELQSKYLPQAEYGYDLYSSWKRGAERVKALLDDFTFLRNPGLPA